MPPPPPSADPNNLATRIYNFYQKSFTRFYVLGFVGFMVGAKVCDKIFYDPRSLQAMEEKMEEEFWKKNGQPKHLIPEMVPRVNGDGMRKSWIKIIYEKDRYIPKS